MTMAPATGPVMEMVADLARHKVREGREEGKKG